MSNHRAFNWSRFPSNEKISSVYISSPKAYATMGVDITNEELIHALRTYNTIRELHIKRSITKNVLIGVVVSIPFLALFYNIFLGVWN